MRFFSFPLIVTLAVFANHHLLRAVELPKSASGVTVSVDKKTGAYSIHVDSPTWTWSGSVDQPLSDIQIANGSDSIGSYAQISFAWKAAEPLTAIIRRYNDQPTLWFSLRYGAAAKRATTFPNFTQFPQNMHPFSYRDMHFAPPAFSLSETSTPWLFFNDKAEAYIFAPASHFMIAKMIGDGKKAIGNALNGRLTAIPQNFAQTSLLTFGDGIHATWLKYGNAQQRLANRERPKNDADPLLKKFGYWTDNGAFYYYNYDLKKGYARTLLDLRRHYEERKIPLGYIQLDSWWYEKTMTGPSGSHGKTKNPRLPKGEWNCYGGLLSYTADPFLFPNGLAAFHREIGLPLGTHNRWIDPASPYHQEYKISGIAAVDPRFWQHIADYCVKSGIICYEQDWLDCIYNYSPELFSTVTAADAFTDNMAAAFKARGISMQYCMAQPRYFLQGTKYDNLTTIRCSVDGLSREKWEPFLYTSQLAAAQGIWPWTDVFRSSQLGSLLVATLSAGPVGIGDETGKENRENIFRAIRSDGVIVKPDESLIPADSSYIHDAEKSNAPFLAWTFTQHADTRTLYFFAFAKSETANNFELKPANHQLRGDVYVYDPINHTGQKIAAGKTWNGTIGKDGFSFIEIAPIGKSGIALLGDKDKFVGAGKARIASIIDHLHQMTAGVVFAHGESPVTLLGYAAKPPTAHIGNASINVQYDKATGQFQVVVPSPTGTGTSQKLVLE